MREIDARGKMISLATKIQRSMSKHKSKAQSVPSLTTDELAGLISNSFNHLHERIGKFEQHTEEKFDAVNERFDLLDKKLDQVEFLVSGQDRRISILEDRIRQLATKVGLDFRQP